jgi:hypothetical protein
MPEPRSGDAAKKSARLPLRASDSARRAYSSAGRTTTASRPCFVTRWGSLSRARRKASFGLLKLPFLPDRLALSSRRTIQRVCVCRPHRGSFLTTLVSLYLVRHIVALRERSGLDADLWEATVERPLSPSRDKCTRSRSGRMILSTSPRATPLWSDSADMHIRYTYSQRWATSFDEAQTWEPSG